MPQAATMLRFAPDLELRAAQSRGAGERAVRSDVKIQERAMCANLLPKVTWGEGRAEQRAQTAFRGQSPWQRVSGQAAGQI